MRSKEPQDDVAFSNPKRNVLRWNFISSVVLTIAVFQIFNGNRVNLEYYTVKSNRFRAILWNVEPVPAISYPVCFNRTESSWNGQNISQAIRETCCAPWDYNLDDWWLHRPDWEVSLQNDTMTCFSPMRDAKRANIMRRIHHFQWKTDCANLTYSPIISSGFGASIDAQAKRMYTSIMKGRPFIHVKHWEGAQWYYTIQTRNTTRTFPNGATFSLPNRTTICPSADFDCYFLNISRCTTKEYFKNSTADRGRPLRDTLNALRWYLTRPQQWLRKKVYDYTKNNYLELSFSSASLAVDIPPAQPCRVLHVRRTDIVLDRDCRKYKPLQQYIDMSNATKGETILLLTDDQSTIDEATYLYSNEYKFLVLNRTRFRGMEGKLENHMPSNDGLKEIIAILAELEMASYCTTFVYAASGFGDFINAWMSMRNTIRANKTAPPVSSINTVQLGNEEKCDRRNKTLPQMRLEKKREAKEFLATLYAKINQAKQTSRADKAILALINKYDPPATTEKLQKALSGGYGDVLN